MFWGGLAVGIVIGSAAGVLLMGMVTAGKTVDLQSENTMLRIALHKAGIEWRED